MLKCGRLKRVKTGIGGLDTMLYGGIPEHNQVIIAGGPGAGKSLLGFEFLYKNALEGNPGVLFMFDEDPAKVIEDTEDAFNQLSDIDSLIKSGKIVIAGDGISESVRRVGGDSTYQFGKLVSDIELAVRKAGATRIVIDPISLIKFMISDEMDYRRSMLALVSDLRSLGVTSLVTVEAESIDRGRLKFFPEYFIFDGIIALYQSREKEKRVQAMEVIKMRGSKHSLATASYDITPQGFSVAAMETVSDQRQ